MCLARDSVEPTRLSREPVELDHHQMQGRCESKELSLQSAQKPYFRADRSQEGRSTPQQILSISDDTHRAVEAIRAIAANIVERRSITVFVIARRED